MTTCKFTVTFEADTGYALDFTNQPIGLNLLDAIREQLHNDDNISIKNIPTDIFQYYKGGMREDKKVEISESVARKSGLFLNTTHIVVTVPKMFLNDFCSLQYNYNTSENTVYATVVLNEQKLLEHWQNNNFSTDLTTDLTTDN